MWLNTFNFRDKFTRIEIIFFILYFLLFDILTGIEYNLYERHHTALFINDVPEQLMYGILNILPFWICYKVLIPGYLFKKKYLRFALLFMLFLVAVNFYKEYSYWLISKLNFLPAKITTLAGRYYKANVLIHFSIIYMLRELLVITALAYFIRSAKQERLLNELKQQQLQTELNYLKVQLQPHFFFNTLNNIYSLALQQSVLTAPLVAKHAEMMRYILYNASRKRVPLQEEVDFLENYVAVEKIRYPGTVNINFEIQGIRSNAFIEPLLLLPFVENSFKHGIREDIKDGYVNIIICQVEQELMLEVGNSRFLNKEQNTDDNGIGLDNACKRLAILYPGKYQLKIKEEESSFEIQLSLTIRSDD